MARHTLFHRDTHRDDRAVVDDRDGTVEETRPYETPYATGVAGDQPDAEEMAERRREAESDHRAAVHDTYGGINWGACFFGWLVAVGMTVLLAAVVSAVATAVGANLDWTRTDAQNNAGSIGLAAAIALAVIMFIGYYAGGYVAGRMSRFDGAHQGLGVWVVSLVVMILVGVATAVWGSQYDIASRLHMPSIDVSTDQLGWGAAITGVVLLAVMLIGAMLGSAVGRRYHTRIDRAGGY